MQTLIISHDAVKAWDLGKTIIKQRRLIVIIDETQMTDKTLHIQYYVMVNNI